MTPTNQAEIRARIMKRIDWTANHETIADALAFFVSQWIDEAVAARTISDIHDVASELRLAREIAAQRLDEIERVKAFAVRAEGRCMRLREELKQAGNWKSMWLELRNSHEGQRIAELAAKEEWRCARCGLFMSVDDTDKHECRPVGSTDALRFYPALSSIASPAQPTPDLGTESVASQLREIVTDQANDPALWHDTDRASEAYLQRALRDLHGVVGRAIAGLVPAQPSTAMCTCERRTYPHAPMTACAAPPSPAAREATCDKCCECCHPRHSVRDCKFPESHISAVNSSNRPSERELMELVIDYSRTVRYWSDPNESACKKYDEALAALDAARSKEGK